MVGHRTLLSLTQFLELQQPELISLILEKHGFGEGGFSNSEQYGPGLLAGLVESLRTGNESQISGLLDEIARTSRDLRKRVVPHYRYDERLFDLQRCLELDGYRIDEDRLVPIDPTMAGTPPVEDDLTRELAMSGLPMSDDVARKLNDSAASFRATPPNYNACLNDARVALQTLATDIAENRPSTHQGSLDRSRWGSVIAYLRAIDFITKEEERGLTGVFGFVSPGSHRIMGLAESESARLGRGLVTGMCWFLVKQFRAGV